MNPRETLLDNLFDEFAAEQSMPLEFQSPLSIGSNSLFSPSTHATVHISAHTNATTSSSSTQGNGSVVLSLTATETDQMNRFIRKMQQVFKIYLGAHGAEVLHKAQAVVSQTRRGGATLSSASTDNAHTPRTAKHLKKTSEEELSLCYLHVPELFFRPEFSLVKQEMFSHAIPLTIPPQDKLQNHQHQLHQYLLRNANAGDAAQEKLAHYLDLVEVALLRQIWSRSPAFFRALDDLKGLQHEVHEAIQELKHARYRLHHLSEQTIAPAMKIPSIHRRHQNSLALQVKLDHLTQWMQGRMNILALLDVEDYFSAHELLFQTKRIYQEHLQGIQAIKPLAAQLKDIEAGVNEVLCNKFVTMAIQWIETSDGSEPVDGTTTTTTTTTNGSKGYTAGLDFDLDELTNNSNSTVSNNSHRVMDRKLLMQQEQQDLCSRLLHSLVANEALLPALNMYKNRLVDGLKLIIRTCVMEYISNFDPTMGSDENPWDVGPYDNYGDTATVSEGGGGGGGGMNTPYVQRIREMSTENFLACLSMSFEHIMTSLKKAEDFHSVLSRILSVKTSSSSSSEEANALVEGEGGGYGFEEEEEEEEDVTTLASSPAVAQAMRKLDAATKEKLVAFSKSVIQSACDVVQKNVSQLINYRRDINAKFEPYRMKFLWEVSLTFVLCLESCATSTATIIRQCLQAQTRAFLEYLHESYKNRMVSTLDNERWVQCDVVAERQREIDRLASGKAFLISSNGGSGGGGTTSSSSGSGSSSSGSGAANANGAGAMSSTLDAENGSGSGSGKKKEKDSRPAMVEGAEYRVVWSVLLLVEIILSYLDIAFHFPPVTPEVIAKIVDQVRLFNLRTKQLVLGAQAIQSAARLKSISAKHLAITGRSLGLFIALLPHIRAALVAQIPPKHQVLLTELDRVSQDLFEHHTAIVAKFVSIIGDTIEASVVKLRQVDWDRPLVPTTHHGGSSGGGVDGPHHESAAASAANSPAVPPAAANSNANGNGNGSGSGSNTAAMSCEYFEDMSKNISTLHKVLLTILPPEQIQDVFFRIFGLINRRILVHFEEIMPSSAGGRQRILDELTHLVSTLARLKHVDATVLTSQLEESMRKKYTRT